MAAKLVDNDGNDGDNEEGDGEPNTELKIGGDENVSQRKRDWMFAGYITFALFAPYGENMTKIMHLNSPDLRVTH